MAHEFLILRRHEEQRFRLSLYTHCGASWVCVVEGRAAWNPRSVSSLARSRVYIYVCVCVCVREFTATFTLNQRAHVRSIGRVLLA